MMLHTRGVRPTARGGAFVGGADDLGALWFNPAGLAQVEGNAVLIDAAWVAQSAEYRRVDSGGNDAGVAENQAPGAPIPSIAGGFALGDDGVIGAGIYAPYAGLVKFDEAGPQRYSVIDLSHTLIYTMAVGVGWRFGKVRVGATVQNWVSQLSQTMVVSGCPGETVCAPEDPEMDAVVETTSNDFFNPSGALGLQIDAARSVTIGASVQAPIKFRGGATLRTRLPSSGFYDGATVAGDQATVEYWFPAVARLGVEVHDPSPDRRWRVELAGDLELWRLHEEMRIVPQEMRIEDAPGVGSYDLGPMAVPRNYEDTYAVSLGAEVRPTSGSLRVLAGYAYETRAAPDEYLSAMTFDGAKHVGTFGLGYQVGATTLDAVIGYAAVEDREVAMGEGRSPQLTPVRDPNDPPLETFVNDGTYSSSWLIVGLGAQSRF
jgi:long-chain fatty acid transport protein